jgi:hypothetical protein
VLADRGGVVINVAIDGVGGKDDLAMAKFDATIASFTRTCQPTVNQFVSKQSNRPK